MSQVKLTKRSKSYEAPMVAAKQLAIYTVKICTNEKNFPKRYRWCITQEIVQTALRIKHEIRIAYSFQLKRSSINAEQNILQEKNKHFWLAKHHFNRAKFLINKKQTVENVRKEHIQIARAHLFDLIDYIDIASELFNIDSKRVQYWVGLVSEVFKALEIWDKDLTG